MKLDCHNRWLAVFVFVSELPKIILPFPLCLLHFMASLLSLSALNSFNIKT